MSINIFVGYPFGSVLERDVEASVRQIRQWILRMSEEDRYLHLDPETVRKRLAMRLQRNEANVSEVAVRAEFEQLFAETKP